MPSAELEFREIKEAPTDDRGRLYLGPKYADQELRVAVLENGED